jgi:hypothetical protein
VVTGTPIDTWTDATAPELLTAIEIAQQLEEHRYGRRRE